MPSAYLVAASGHDASRHAPTHSTARSLQTLGCFSFKNMKKTLLAIAILAITLLCACQQEAEWREMPVKGNAVYYWRTHLALDSAETNFLKQHDIRRIYCRYFDVVLNGGDEPMPNATITFGPKPLLPQNTELVPTVFITENCLRSSLDSLPRRIVRRILQMNETNDIDSIHEIQVDCDYTERSRDTFYKMLDEMRQLCHDNGLTLSATIRLHQLSMPAPPADYGVLMLYNTGDPSRFDERNPILDLRDVAPYTKHLAGFDLPLAAAYPVFLWRRNIHGTGIEHQAPFETIADVKKAVEKRRPDLAQLILTYHLSTDNINRYSTEEYETIYQH